MGRRQLVAVEQNTNKLTNKEKCFQFSLPIGTYGTAILLGFCLHSFVFKLTKTLTKISFRPDNITKSRQYEIVAVVCSFSTNESCRCPSNYISFTCELYKNCANKSCQHGGTCYKTNITVMKKSDIQCECADGTTGKLCETNLDDCRHKKCLHESKCVDEIDGYHCDCQLGTTGKHCETNIDKCKSNPCINNGLCFNEITKYKCYCSKYDFGINCEKSAPCFTERKFTHFYMVINLDKSKVVYAIGDHLLIYTSLYGKLTLLKTTEHSTKAYKISNIQLKYYSQILDVSIVNLNSANLILTYNRSASIYDLVYRFSFIEFNLKQGSAFDLSILYRQYIRETCKRETHSTCSTNRRQLTLISIASNGIKHYIFNPYFSHLLTYGNRKFKRTSISISNKYSVRLRPSQSPFAIDVYYRSTIGALGKAFYSVETVDVRTNSRVLNLTTIIQREPTGKDSKVIYFVLRDKCNNKFAVMRDKAERNKLQMSISRLISQHAEHVTYINAEK